MKRIFSILTAIFIFCFGSLIVSCNMDTVDIDIDGTLTSSTGTYAQNLYITYSVTGGTAPYTMYYYRGTDSWDYAQKNRGRLSGSVGEGEEWKLNVDGYRSVGWYHYLWAKDSDGNWSNGVRWYGGY